MAKSLPTGVDSHLSKKSRKKSTKPTLVLSEDVGATPTETTVPTDSPTKPSGPEGIDTETMFENKKARKRAIRAARHRKPSEDDASPSMEALNSKKRKDRSDDGNGNDTSQNPEASAEEPPKKKHKNRTEFADPRYDQSLNPQSRKALEYAFTQMNKPSKWKFHKARQNWLIRNIWSPELLPEIYVPLVWKYLANIQGGSKQKLIETCQSHLKIEEKKEPEAETRIEATDAKSTPTTEKLSPPPPPPLKSILKPTPGPLIPGPLIDIPSTSTPKSEGAVVADAPTENTLSPAALADIRRTRALGLLEILGAS